MKVLIVEDDFISRNYLHDLVKYSGYDCKTAKNAADGFDMYLNYRPDVIVCNIVMPGISGLEFLQKIRAIDRNTIIIMITSVCSERLAVDALRLGANDYLRKPVQDNDLIPALKRAGSHIELDDENSQKYGVIDSGKIIMKFDTDINAPRLIVDRLMEEIAPDYFEDDARANIEIGLSELVTNAIEHGNLDITFEEKSEMLKNFTLEDLYSKRMKNKKLADRKVTVEYSFSPSKCEWTITDEGNGFDPSAIPDPSSPENIECLNGRGIFFSKRLFDSVEYIGKGNIVRAVKMCQKSVC
ncbi:MAG: response regulator [Bacteroidales bacterium]|nr:response regulator [Bacteroidales bacterium]MBR4215947.1 response regulator [Bacteroidales bacterium]